jgi:hypothetical protein
MLAVERLRTAGARPLVPRALRRGLVRRRAGRSRRRHPHGARGQARRRGPAGDRQGSVVFVDRRSGRDHRRRRGNTTVVESAVRDHRQRSRDAGLNRRVAADDHAAGQLPSSPARVPHRSGRGPANGIVRHPSITRWSSPGTARGESRARSRSDCRRAPLHTLSPPRRRGPGVAGGRRGSRGTGHVVPEADELGWARFYGGVARRARTAPSALGLDQTQEASVRRFHTRPSGRRYRERIAEMTEIFHGPTHDSGSVRR